MPQRITGLVGKGKGPRIHVDSAATRLFAEIRGLPDGHHIVVNVVESINGGTARGYIQTFDCDGEHDIPLGREVQFSYDGPGIPICAVKVA